MPYVTKELRESLDMGTEPSTAGELNYKITRACLNYLEAKGPASYALYNEVIGVLECAKLEMYRRVVAPYENSKAEANGDVYES